MAGIVGKYIIVPKFRQIVSCVTFEDVAGVNPVDLSPQSLPNQRGQLMIQGTSVDNGFTWSFDVEGGTGNFPSACNQNFGFVRGSNVNSTVTMPATNRFRVETPAGDAGGRVYFFQFFSEQSVGPTIQQTSANVLTDDLIIKIAKTILVS